jgi:hypothetical protein
MDRREFVAKSLVAVGGAMLGSATAGLGAPPGGARPPGGAGAAGAGAVPEPPPGKSTVAVCRDTRLETLPEDQQDPTLKYLVHLGVQSAVGGATAVAAWQRLFKPTDVVAVKLSCLAPQFAPHPTIVEAIIDGLKSCNIPDQNIILYDKEDRDLAGAGYDLNATGKGVQCYGTLGGPNEPGYEDRFTLKGDTSFCLSKIVTRAATAIINVPVVKHHEYAGMSCALKNHFGSINNPSKFHMIGGCDPAVADVNRALDLRTKQRLVICDALRILYDRGPSFHAECVMPYSAVLVSKDPVALDYQAMQLIEAARKAKGLCPLSELKYPPLHIATAAGYELGTNDPRKISLAVHDLGG